MVFIFKTLKITIKRVHVGDDSSSNVILHFGSYRRNLIFNLEQIDKKDIHLPHELSVKKTKHFKHSYNSNIDKKVKIDEKNICLMNRL